MIEQHKGGPRSKPQTQSKPESGVDKALDEADKRKGHETPNELAGEFNEGDDSARRVKPSNERAGK